MKQLVEADEETYDLAHKIARIEGVTAEDVVVQEAEKFLTRGVVKPMDVICTPK